MDNKLREIILNIVLEELESNTSPTGDLESFKEIILNDFGIEAGEDAFNFYIECHSLNPQGFYLVYKNELEFSPEFKAKYGFEEDVVNESKESKKLIKENEEDKDSFKVQEIDREGNKLDQFANFATAEEAIAFAKTLKTPVEVIDTTLSESLKEEKVIWTNLDTLEEALSRDAMISELKAKGKNYNFNKYSDSQIYYMYQREMNKKVEKPSNKIEANDEYKEIKKCPQCNHRLTDVGQCPVCDLGDEEERENHMLHLDESLFNNPIDYFNDQETLNEDRIDRKMAKADKKADKVAEKAGNPKALRALIASTYKDSNNSYLIGGKWYKGTDAQQLIKSAANDLQSMDTNLVNLDRNKVSRNVIDAINAIVVNGQGYVIRRGLEILKPNQVRYNPKNPDSIKLKDSFNIENIIGKAPLPQTENPNSEEASESEPKSNVEAETSEKSNVSEVQPETSNPETPAESSDDTNASENSSSDHSWVTPEAVKSTLTLLGKRKDPTVIYYTKDGKSVSYKDVNMDNIDQLYVDKEAKKSFLDAMKEVKSGLAKKKEAAIKSAAIFGESYDDSMEYEEYEDQELDEGMSKDEMDEFFKLSREIGLEDVHDVNRFIKDEAHPGESVLDTLRRYIDSGDDLQEIEDDSWLPKSELSDEDIYDTKELYPSLSKYID